MESASEPFLNELLKFFKYPSGSAGALLAGTLPLRYCAARFASRTLLGSCRCLQCCWFSCCLFWVVQEVAIEGVFRRVSGVSGFHSLRNRIRLNRKPPAHLAGLVVQSRPRVWKRLSHVGHLVLSLPDRKRRRRDQSNGDYVG